jgi:hypothetical protein
VAVELRLLVDQEIRTGVAKQKVDAGFEPTLITGK